MEKVNTAERTDNDVESLKEKLHNIRNPVKIADEVASLKEILSEFDDLSNSGVFGKYINVRLLKISIGLDKILLNLGTPEPKKKKKKVNHTGCYCMGCQKLHDGVCKWEDVKYCDACDRRHSGWINERCEAK